MPVDWDEGQAKPMIRSCRSRWSREESGIQGDLMPMHDERVSDWDRPAAVLDRGVADRNLLKDTLGHCVTEFSCTSGSQDSKSDATTIRHASR